MGNSRKYCITLLLVILLIMTLALLGTGCTPAESNTGSKTSSETAEIEEPDSMQSRVPDGRRPGASGNGTVLERPDGRQFPMGRGNMDEVAEALGIEPEVLEDAFAQAQSEIFVEGQAPFGESVPEGAPPEVQGGMMPEALLARVAEILGIDQQELEDAFTDLLAQFSGAAPPPPTPSSTI